MADLKNHMEMIVKEELDLYLKDIKNVCKCELCKLDMLAYILNKLPAHYIVTESGYIYTKLDEMRTQFKVDILRYTMQAVKKVSENKRCKN